MQGMYHLNNLRADRRMQWLGGEHGWVARSDEIVATLANDGSYEYTREEARSARGRRAAGGVWAGIKTRTGAIDGRPITNE